MPGPAYVVCWQCCAWLGCIGQNALLDKTRKASRCRQLRKSHYSFAAFGAAQPIIDVRKLGNMTIEQSILDAIRALPPEKQLQVLQHARELGGAEERSPRKSGRGLWADLNFTVSEEDIEESRRDMWRNFPRDDF